MTALEPFKLERFFAAHEFSAEHLLSSSDAETISVRDLLALDGKTPDFLGSLRLGYSESKGMPALRQGIASMYKKIDWQETLVHVGAEEPILNLFLSSTQPGDHVIVHFPCYQSYYSVPRRLGVDVSLWEGKIEKGWQPDLGELKKLFRPGKTKILIINFPHNPTGFIPSLDYFLELIEFARSENLILLSDEVYRESEMNKKDRLPAGADLYEKAISLSVLSKSYGLPGLRVGWIATRDREVFEKLVQAKDYSTICNPLITEVLAEVALRHREALGAKTVALVSENWKLVEEFFSSYEDLFEVVPPKGGTMVYPLARGIDMDVFGERLIRERKTMLISGAHFGQDPRYFRLGLGRKEFPAAFKNFTDLFGTEQP